MRRSHRGSQSVEVARAGRDGAWREARGGAPGGKAPGGRAPPAGPRGHGRRPRGRRGGPPPGAAHKEARRFRARASPGRGHRTGAEGRLGWSSVSEGECERSRRALKRLLEGHREANGVIDHALEEDQALEDQEYSAQESLAEVQDTLSGGYEDARTIL